MSTPPGRLAGKTALVLGGTRGIGRGIVERLAGDGANVTFAGRDRTTGAAVQQAVAEAGGRAEFVQCDVIDLPHLKRTISAVAEQHGRLDTLVNNAGYVIGHSLLESTEDDYNQLFELNVRATFFAMKWAAELMVKAGGGSIINITASAATRGFANRTLYCGTKGAVLQMSRAAALDVARHHVRINCISPGPVDTDLLRSTHFQGKSDVDRLVAEFGAQQPSGRLGSIRDIGAAAAYFASDDAAWITGANLNVDGGRSI